MSNLKNSPSDNKKIKAMLSLVGEILLEKELEEGVDHNDQSRIALLKKTFNKKENASVENYEEVKPVHNLVFDARKTDTERVRELNKMFGITLDKNGFPVMAERPKLNRIEEEDSNAPEGEENM